MDTFQTDQIYIYPVKSLGAVRKLNISICETGLEHDRMWMLVNEFGEMISQRTFPSLNQIKCLDNGIDFKLSVPGQGDVPVVLTKIGIETQEAVQVSLWSQKFYALHPGSEVATCLSRYLSTKVRLVYSPRRSKQFTIANRAFEIPLAFQDGGPVHIVNLRSVQWLSEKCGLQIDPLQFRANLYVDFGQPFAEDHLEKFAINGMAFRSLKPCERCIMVNLQPNSAIFLEEPLKTLSKHRKSGNKVHFGIYALPEPGLV